MVPTRDAHYFAHHVASAVHDRIVREATATTAARAALVQQDEFILHEKYGSLVVCIPLVLFLALAWGYSYYRKDLFHPDSMPYTILASLSFGACSISMHTLNKACVMLTGAPSTLTTIQMAMTVVMTMALNHREVLGADRKKMLQWMIVPLVYAGMLNSSLLGYKYLSLSLVTVFRNLSPLVTLTVEGLIIDAQNAPKVTRHVIGSLMMMVAGAIVFSFGQAESTKLGLCIVTLNTLLAIGDRVLQRRLLVTECKDLPLAACMTLNNTLGMLPTFAMALTMHEMDGYASHRANWTDPATIVLIALSGCMGMGIGFYGLMCQRAMTATSFQVLQNISKVVLVLVGIYVFQDRIDSPTRVAGMGLSLLGSLLYGFARASETPAVPAEAVPDKLGPTVKPPDLSALRGERQPLLGGRFAPFAAAVGFYFNAKRSSGTISC